MGRLGLDLKVAVNLAMANLIDSQLPDDVAALLAKHKLPPSRLILEITENVVMADPTRTLAILDRLRSLGRRACRSTTSAPGTPRSPTCASCRSTS